MSAALKGSCLQSDKRLDGLLNVGRACGSNHRSGQGRGLPVQAHHDKETSWVFTMTKDKASCIVFCMPKEAIKTGAVDKVLPLGDIAGAILAHVGR